MPILHDKGNNVIWNTANNEIWFASTQTKMLELFVQRFLATFKLHIEQLTPSALALSMLGDAAEADISGVEPTQFSIEN